MQERLALQDAAEKQQCASEKGSQDEKGTHFHIERKGNTSLLQPSEGSFKDWTQFVHDKNKFLSHYFNIT